MRSDFRSYLLKRALGEMRAPIIPGFDVGKRAFDHSIEPFADDGELVLMTGRLDYQKGVDILLKAVPEVIDVIPSAKFLLLLIPIMQKEIIDSTVDEALKYKNNVRLVLGRVPEIYGLAHVSADVYAMPSRWEPFGITALEAMATGNPVAGTSVGGITETVLDVFDQEKGTGHLVSTEDYRELARSLVVFLLTMKLDTDANVGQNSASLLIDRIPYDEIREMVIEDVGVGSKIRDNCRMRVKTQFSTSKSAKMAVAAYERASKISTQRMGSGAVSI